MDAMNCPECGASVTAPVEIIPLARAVLCADCNQITMATNGHCLACGSHSIMNLGKVLDRKENIDQQDGQDDKSGNSKTEARNS